ncbi:MAG: carbohydrate kinase family protein [Lachnospiraceae bacterium]|nr:carbohydrate kinase family protein [Lachnospiraceae bacterium]
MKNYKYDIVCIGVALVDSIVRGFDPKPISKAGFFADSGSLAVGGEALNGSITASKLGLKSAIVTGLGYDAAAELVTGALEKNGVDISNCVRNEEIHTPVSTLLVNLDGTRKSIMNHSHRYNFHPENHMDVLQDTPAVAIGSLFRPPFNEPEIIFKVLSRAKELGLTVYADTKLPNYNTLSLDDVRESLQYIDYIFPNEDEAAFYSGETDPDKQAEVFLKYGVKTAIIKLGAKGCLLKNSRERVFLPALKIDPVDAVGAGDNFMAGFITARHDGKTDAEALEFANACGAICTEHIGATTGIQNKKQVLERLALIN